MKNALLSLAVLGLFGAIAATPSKDKNNKPFKVVCYWGSWSNYRQGDGKFVPENIDPHICTHIIYGFVKLNNNNEVAPYDPYLDLKENWGLGAYQRFNALREKNPHLTTLVAIGGWNEGSAKYSNMASNPGYRKIFIASVLKFLEKHGFDGFDMDWEYPANRGGVAEDKQNYVTLLKEMKEAFQPEGYLLTAAVAAGQGTIDTAYDIPGVAKYLDFINVMAYDFHGAWDKYTHHNAPLYEKADDSEKDKTYTVDYAIKYWIKMGARPDQVILGMPLYGRGWTLAKAGEDGIRATGNQPSMAGPITRENGYLGYNEMCPNFKDPSWKITWDDDWKAPYMVKGNQWIGFDNIQSIKEKLDYTKRMKLGGAMVWSLETDDFHGKCGDGRFPLVSLMGKILNDDTYVPPPVDPRPSTPKPGPGPTEGPRPVQPTTENPVVGPGGDTGTGGGIGNGDCPSAGFFRVATDCNKFYQCAGKGGPIYHFSCPEGLRFHTTLNVCMRPEDVTDC